MTAHGLVAAFAAELGVPVPEGPQFDELLALARRIAPPADAA